MSTVRQERRAQLQKAAELLRESEKENVARDERLAILITDLASRQEQIDQLKAQLEAQSDKLRAQRQAFDFAREALTSLGNLI